MRMNYPTNWAQINGSDCYSDGELTPIAKNWLHEISCLTKEQLSTGMTKLSRLKTNGFAPNVMQFVQHCRDVIKHDVMDDIWCFIRRSQNDDYWWQTEIGYNVFKKLQYNPALNEPTYKVQEKIESIYDSMDFSNLEPIPEKPIAIPEKPRSKEEFLHRLFQSKIYKAIEDNKPELIIQPLDPDGRTLNGLPVPDEIKATWGRQDKTTVNL